jgi:hypothetical protein
MREEIETEKSLAQLKRFIVREMKNQSADWVKTKIQPSYGPDQKGFKSEYLKILKEIKRNNDADDNRPYYIHLCDGRDECKYELKDIGLSKIRFYFLLQYVKRFCKRRDELQKKERLAVHWESFLKRNKVLDRDRKIDEILK